MTSVADVEEVARILEELGFMDIRYTIHYQQGSAKITMTFYTSRQEGTKKQLSHEVVSAMRKDRKRGLTFREIAKKHRVSVSTAYAYCH